MAALSSFALNMSQCLLSISLHLVRLSQFKTEQVSFYRPLVFILSA